jgi:hypothetical protein
MAFHSPFSLRVGGERSDCPERSRRSCRRTRHNAVGTCDAGDAVIVALMKSSTDHDRFNFAHPYYQACP